MNFCKIKIVGSNYANLFNTTNGLIWLRQMFFTTTARRHDDTTFFALRASIKRREASYCSGSYRRVVVSSCRRGEKIAAKLRDSRLDTSKESTPFFVLYLHSLFVPTHSHEN